MPVQVTGCHLHRTKGKANKNVKQSIFCEGVVVLFLELPELSMTTELNSVKLLQGLQQYILINILNITP